MMLNRWVLFESDVCEICNHPKLAKMCHDQKDGLQVIISCDCDTCVFDGAWKHARDSDEVIVLIDVKVIDFIEELAKSISEAS